MNSKKCLKCGHDAAFDVRPPQACPSCGAIYAKVEEALRQGLEVRKQPSQEAANAFQNTIPEQPCAAPRARPQGGDEVDVHAFAQRMREESLYPAWRKIVGFFTALGYIVAAIVLMVAVITAAKGSTWAVVIGIGMAAAIALMAKVGKELSLMLADLSDAAVRMAAGRERTGAE